MGSGTSRPRNHRRRGHKRPLRGQREVAKVEQEIAIRQQLAETGLAMENEPWATWYPGGGLPRILALLIHRLKMKHRGEYVPPFPWLAAGVSVAILVVILVGLGVIAYLAVH